MVKKGMNEDEIYNSLKRSYDWVAERERGLMIKNKKKIQSAAYKNNDILSVSKYITPEQEEVVVYTIKHIIQAGKKDVLSAAFVSYYDTELGFILPTHNPNFGKGLYEYFVFTKHAIDRLKDRLGKTFIEFFEKDYLKRNASAYGMEKYDHNNDPNEYVCRMGDAFLICAIEGKGIFVKTILSTSEMHSNQLVLMLQSQKSGQGVLNEAGKREEKEALFIKKMCKKLHTRHPLITYGVE